MANEDFSVSIGTKTSKTKKAKLKKRAQIENKTESDVLREAVDNHMLGWDEDCADLIKTENKVPISQEQDTFSTSHVKSDGIFYCKDLLPANNKNGISKKDAENVGNLVGAAIILLSILANK